MGKFTLLSLSLIAVTTMYAPKSSEINIKKEAQKVLRAYTGIQELTPFILPFLHYQKDEVEDSLSHRIFNSLSSYTTSIHVHTNAIRTKLKFCKYGTAPRHAPLTTLRQDAKTAYKAAKSLERYARGISTINKKTAHILKKRIKLCNFSVAILMEKHKKKTELLNEMIEEKWPITNPVFKPAAEKKPVSPSLLSEHWDWNVE